MMITRKKIIKNKRIRPFSNHAVKFPASKTMQLWHLPSLAATVPMRPEEVEGNDDLFLNHLCGESPFKSIFSRWNGNAMQNISLSVHNSTIAQLSGIFLPLPLLLKYWIDLAMMDRLCPIHIYIYIFSKGFQVSQLIVFAVFGAVD